MPSSLTKGFVVFIDLDKWLLSVNCPTSALAQRIGSLFGRRTSFFSPDDPKKRHLSCQVMMDPEGFQKRLSSYAFEHSSLQVAADVAVHYEITPSATLFRIERTAIVEIRYSQPEEAWVYLDPVSYPEDMEAKKADGPIAEPEAFLYPLCCEWFLHLDACLMHCGAVEIDGRAIVFTGPPGSGKSTHVIRSVIQGARFLADDLSILHRHESGLRMSPYREVANARQESINTFQELAFLKDSPLRGDGKYCIEIASVTNAVISRGAVPGAVLHINKNTESLIQKRDPAMQWDGLSYMAWFVSGPVQTKTHFHLLTDWLSSSRHYDISWGALLHQLPEVLERASAKS